MAESVKGILLAREILASMHPRMKLEAVTLYKDNNEAIHLANHPMGSARSKHRHPIRIPLYSRSHEEGRQHGNCDDEMKLQHADLLTEDLGGDALGKHRGYVMNLTLDYWRSSW